MHVAHPIFPRQFSDLDLPSCLYTGYEEELEPPMGLRVLDSFPRSISRCTYGGCCPRAIGVFP